MTEECDGPQPENIDEVADQEPCFERKVPEGVELQGRGAGGYKYASFQCRQVVPSADDKTP